MSRPKEGRKRLWNFSDAPIPEIKIMFLFLAVNVKPTPRGFGHNNLASYWSAQKAFFCFTLAGRMCKFYTSQFDQ
jgi:hypothetical protein